MSQEICKFFVELELAQNALFFYRVVELVHGQHIFAHYIQCDYILEISFSLMSVVCKLPFLIIEKRHFI